ncbi:hypothetical protein J0X19_23860, partial [Hymenobacter sp. BT186]
MNGQHLRGVLTRKNLGNTIIIVVAVLLNLGCWYVPWKIPGLRRLYEYEPENVSRLMLSIKPWVVSWLKNPTDYYYTDWQLLVYALGLGFLINLL